MSLVAWYPLNKDTRNLGNSDYNITQSGINLVDGKIGQAANFPRNTSSTLTMKKSPIKSETFSISGWLYLNNVISGGHYCWVSCRKAIGQGLSVFVNPQKKLRLDLLANATSGQWITNYEFPIGQWVHITITFNKGIATYYVNGEYQESRTIEQYSTDTLATAMSIGASSTNGSSLGNSWDGKMNDLRFYDHCLSQAEVKEVYKTLILKYSFDYPIVSPIISRQTGDTINGKLDISSKLNGANNSCVNIGTIINNNEYIIQNDYITLSFDIEIKGLSVAEGQTSARMMLQDQGRDIEGTTKWNVFITNNDVEKKGRTFLNNSEDGEFLLSNDGKYHIVRTYKIPQSALDIVNNWTVQIRIDYIQGGTAIVSNFKVVLGKYETICEGTNNVVYDESGFKNDGMLLTSDEDRAKTSYSTDSIIGNGCYLSKRTNQAGEGTYGIIRMNEPFPSIKEFSVSFWVNLSKYTDNESSFIGCSQDSNTWAMWIRHTSNNLTFTLYNNSLGISQQLELNKWYYIAATAQSEGKMKVYINGEQVGEKDISSGTDWENSYFTVGDLRKDRGLSFNGRIDDVRVYATALNDKDIKKLYLDRTKIDNYGNLYCNEMNEYLKEVEYIESNGAEYIDTGIIPTINTGIVMDFQLTQDIKQQRVATVNDTTVGDCYLCIYENGNGGLSFGNIGNRGGWIVIANDVTFDRHVMKYNIDDKVFLDNISKTLSKREINISFTLSLFGERTSTSVTNRAAMKLYSCQIYERDILIRDFIPTISIEDGHIGEACLFDTVEKKYYYNQGDGKFFTNLDNNKKKVNVSGNGIVNCNYLIEGNDITKVLNKESIIKTNQIKEY